MSASDWSSDVCSSDLEGTDGLGGGGGATSSTPGPAVSGKGGDGIIFLRCPGAAGTKISVSPGSNTKTTLSPSGDTLLTFNVSGTLTINP
jgi:hypothetical protein